MLHYLQLSKDASPCVPSHASVANFHSIIKSKSPSHLPLTLSALRDMRHEVRLRNILWHHRMHNPLNSDLNGPFSIRLCSSRSIASNTTLDLIPLSLRDLRSNTLITPNLNSLRRCIKLAWKEIKLIDIGCNEVQMSWGPYVLARWALQKVPVKSGEVMIRHECLAEGI
ncbi:hypothetical protein Tco_1316747 [Tanacetum coccineum]